MRKKRLKSIILFLALFCLATTSAFAQLTEGHVTYTITTTSDDSEISEVITMVGESNLDVYFSGDISRTDYNLGSMGSTSTILDDKSGEVLMLMRLKIGNIAVFTTQTEMWEARIEPAHELKLELQKEKKKIQGYKCKKAVLKDEAGTELIYWYTKAIKSPIPQTNSLASEIEGFPMEFEVKTNGLKMSFVASNVTKSLTEAEKTEFLGFSIPEGYEEISFEDYQYLR